MPKTALMGWTYPGFKEVPFFPAFEEFIRNADADVYAQLEMIQTVPIGGGTMSFDSATGTFSWPEALEFVVLTTGRIATVAPGAIVVNDGEILYIVMPRPMTENVTVQMQKATQLKTDRQVQLVGFRRGSHFFLGNPAVEL